MVAVPFGCNLGAARPCARRASATVARDNVGPAGLAAVYGPGPLGSVLAVLGAGAITTTTPNESGRTAISLRAMTSARDHRNAPGVGQ
jgi:hypothetical protein